LFPKKQVVGRSDLRYFLGKSLRVSAGSGLLMQIEAEIIHFEVVLKGIGKDGPQCAGCGFEVGLIGIGVEAGGIFEALVAGLRGQPHSGKGKQKKKEGTHFSNG
jgi:hypothetical protein